MTTKELIAVLRHYAALYPHQVCPPGVLLAAAEAPGLQLFLGCAASQVGWEHP